MNLIDKPLIVLNFIYLHIVDCENRLLTSARNYLREFEGNFLSVSEDVIFESTRNKVLKRTIMADGTCSRQRLPLLFKPSDPPFISPFPGQTFLG